MLRHCLLSTLCLCLSGFAPPAFASDLASQKLPAISGINAKASAFLGSVDGDFGTGVLGSLSFPVTNSFGIQIDGGIGSAKSAAFWGVAGHAFWRDPARGLIGFYGSYTGWDLNSTAGSTALSGGFVDVSGAEIGKVGAEAEIYLGRVSLEGLFGYQYGTKEGATGKAIFAFYPTDNLRLAAGAKYLTGPGAFATFDAEWQPHAEKGLTAYASGSVGSNDRWSAVGGLRVYFAKDGKPLIRRHREDDPAGLSLPEDLFSVTGADRCPPPSWPQYTLEGPPYCGGEL